MHRRLIQSDEGPNLATPVQTNRVAHQRCSHHRSRFHYHCCRSGVPETELMEWHSWVQDEFDCGQGGQDGEFRWYVDGVVDRSMPGRGRVGVRVGTQHNPPQLWPAYRDHSLHFSSTGVCTDPSTTVMKFVSVTFTLQTEKIVILLLRCYKVALLV